MDKKREFQAALNKKKKVFSFLRLSTVSFNPKVVVSNRAGKINLKLLVLELNQNKPDKSFSHLSDSISMLSTGQFSD